MLNKDAHRHLGFVMIGDSILEGLSWPAKHAFFFSRSSQDQGKQPEFSSCPIKSCANAYNLVIRQSRVRVYVSSEQGMEK